MAVSTWKAISVPPSPHPSVVALTLVALSVIIGPTESYSPACDSNNTAIFLNISLDIPKPKWTVSAEEIFRVNYSFLWSRELLEQSGMRFRIAALTTNLDSVIPLDSDALTERFHNRTGALTAASRRLHNLSVEIDGCMYELFEDYITIETDFLGRANLTVVLYDGVKMASLKANATSNDTKDHYSATASIIVLKKIRTVEIVFRVFIYIFIVVITFSMGANLDPVIIWNYMRRPIAPAIGFGCQYVLMPMIAFGMAMVIPMSKAHGFGLVTVGCSPGGGASNIWTMLLKGDLNLSMVMTFFSSTAALGMMPLWLFLLKNYFLETSVKVPFAHIIGDLLMVVIPVCSGMFLRWKKERLALIVCRITTPLSHAFVIYILTFSTYVNWYIFRMFYRLPQLMIIGASLPWAGFLAGLLAAFLLRQTRAQMIAIALETGIQNVGIAIVVLMYSFEQPEGSIGAAMPIAVSLFTPVPLYVILGATKLYQRITKGKVDKKVPIEVEDTPPGSSDDKDDDIEKQSLFNSYKSSSKEESIPMEQKEKSKIALLES